LQDTINLLINDLVIPVSTPLPFTFQEL